MHTLQSHMHRHLAEGEVCSLPGLVQVLQRCCQIMAHGLSHPEMRIPLQFTPWLEGSVLPSA